MSHVQRVPKLLLVINEWQAQGKVDKETAQKMSNLAMSKNDAFLALADEIGVTPDADLLTKALAVLSNPPPNAAPAAAASSSSTSPPAAGASSSGGIGARIAKGRPALNMGAVKQSALSEEAARASEVESQADALLRAKRERALKRQSMPEKTGLPDSVQGQMRQ